MASPPSVKSHRSSELWRRLELPDEAKGLDAGTTIGALSLAAKLADQELKLASSGSVGGELESIATSSRTTS